MGVRYKTFYSEPVCILTHTVEDPCLGRSAKVCAHPNDILKSKKIRRNFQSYICFPKDLVANLGKRSEGAAAKRARQRCTVRSICTLHKSSDDFHLIDVIGLDVSSAAGKIVHGRNGCSLGRQTLVTHLKSAKFQHQSSLTDWINVGEENNIYLAVQEAYALFQILHSYIDPKFAMS